MRWIFVGVWGIAVISVTAFVWVIRAPQSNQHIYYTSVISSGDSQNHMTVYGKVWIDKETTLVPLSDGNVSEVLVKPGDKVVAGQLLATLDVTAEDLDNYEKLRQLVTDAGPIENLNKSLADINRLEQKGFYDALEASKKRSEIYSSLSQLMSYRSNLQKQFDMTHGKMIKAPFDGRVTDVRLRVGQRVSTRDDKIDVSISIAPKPFKVGVELEISDALLPRISPGQKLSVSIPLSQVDSFKGTVQSISHQVYDDKKKRYFKVLGEINPGKGSSALASGMRVVVDVQSPADEKLTWIPKAALDIHLDDKLIDSKMSYVPTSSRSVASTKGADFKQTSKSLKQDQLKDQSSSSRLIANEVFPHESQTSEIYILTADNRVIEATIQRVREAGEMVAVEGHQLRGMRVITHYRPKETLW